MTIFAVPLLFLALGASPETGRYFTIEVVDEQTGRGVPLVELRTVHQLRLLTDSNGLVAFYEPGLMGKTVFFHVQSHGYEYPKDGFGYRGKALPVTEGGRARLSLKRINLAERLYRVTGGGIYRDSVLLGRPVPIREPVLNAQVLGQDSVVNALYRGRLFWFWGDTSRPSYPLGNFHVPGATSRLPSDGGLDPESGVDLNYFLDKDGFAKPTCRMPGEGPTWISGLASFRDAEGRERMFASYVKIRNLLEAYEHGLVEFDPQANEFVKVTTFPEGAPLYPEGHVTQGSEEGVDYLYYGNPFPLIRVKADPSALKDLSKYEAFTCLKPGSRLDQPTLDRDDAGTLRYGWKADTPVVGPRDQGKLIQAGVLKPEEVLLALRDVETGKAVLAAGGSVCWNAYRQRWVMIAVESFGTSMLGEVWYAEADTPLGPWVYARKIVSHDKYSFYNPKQHPYFDKEGGRFIFFEGTYANTFSGNPDQTPLYDYNQIMYKLDLSDPRLHLPVPVYRWKDEDGNEVFGTKARRRQGRTVAFFALDRPGPGTVPIWETRDENGTRQLVVGERPGSSPLFHALPAAEQSAPETSAPLFEFIHKDGSRRTYSTDPEPPTPDYRRSERPLC
ncbi:MAG: hypothetical protein IRY99_19235, partial [Isosphaeraceae bacterium]|nr:hypothetical protein [Isosphaeraceae bacterium]